METRVNVVTLATGDLGKTRAFYESGLGWAPVRVNEGIMVYYRAGSLLVALCEHGALSRETGVHAVPFSGSILLSHNTRTREEADAVLDSAKAAGGRIVKPPAATAWGGYSGTFADPDGHAWEVVWNPKWPLDENGVLRIPD